MVKIPISLDHPEPPTMKPLEIPCFLVMLQRFSFWRFFGDLFGTLAILKYTPYITLRFSVFCKQNKEWSFENQTLRINWSSWLAGSVFQKFVSVYKTNIKAVEFKIKQDLYYGPKNKYISKMPKRIFCCIFTHRHQKSLRLKFLFHYVS